MAPCSRKVSRSHFPSNSVTAMALSAHIAAAVPAAWPNATGIVRRVRFADTDDSVGCTHRSAVGPGGGQPEHGIQPPVFAITALLHHMDAIAQDPHTAVPRPSVVVEVRPARNQQYTPVYACEVPRQSCSVRATRGSRNRRQLAPYHPTNTLRAGGPQNTVRTR